MTSGAHQFAVVVGYYDPAVDTKHYNGNFTYKVKHVVDNICFFYTEEMIDECKELLKVFYERS